MKYSFLVPVHNKLEEVKRCIKSLQEQTYKDYEIVIVDDASEEQTKNYLIDLENHFPNIRVIRNEENEGIGKTRNKLIKNGNGKYFIFIDSDDYVEKELLEKIEECLEKEDLDIVRFGNISEAVTPLQKEREKEKDPYRFSVPGTPTIKGEEALMKWCMGSNKLNTMPWTYCIKRERYDGVRYPGISYLEDFPITHYLIAGAQKVKAIDYIGYHYLQYDSSLTKETPKDKLETLEDLILYTKLLLDVCPMNEYNRILFYRDLDERLEIRQEKHTK